MAFHPKLHVVMEGVKLDFREVELLAENLAKQMNGSVLQLRSYGTSKLESAAWEFWIELDFNRYR